MKISTVTQIDLDTEELRSNYNAYRKDMIADLHNSMVTDDQVNPRRTVRAVEFAHIVDDPERFAIELSKHGIVIPVRPTSRCEWIDYIWDNPWLAIGGDIEEEGLDDTDKIVHVYLDGELIDRPFVDLLDNY